MTDQEKIAILCYFVEIKEDQTEVRAINPLPEWITNEATDVLNQIDPDRIRT